MENNELFKIVKDDSELDSIRRFDIIKFNDLDFKFISKNSKYFNNLYKEESYVYLILKRDITNAENKKYNFQLTILKYEDEWFYVSYKLYSEELWYYWQNKKKKHLKKSTEVEANEYICDQLYGLVKLIDYLYEQATKKI